MPLPREVLIRDVQNVGEPAAPEDLNQPIRWPLLADLDAAELLAYDHAIEVEIGVYRLVEIRRIKRTVVVDIVSSKVVGDAR
jgi:hypothetical protein